MLPRREALRLWSSTSRSGGPGPESSSGRGPELFSLELVDPRDSTPDRSAARRGSSPPRILEVRQNILKANDLQARELRETFSGAGVYVVNLVSSPGSGKTELLVKTLGRLREAGRRVAAVVGDLATENDARRLAASGAPSRQIITGTVCHLEVPMIRKAIEGWDLATLDFLFIENVGNLVCPASFDLGEHLRVLVFAVTEGEDKPLKYPTLINTSDLAIITKSDLAEATGFDRAAAMRNIEQARPGAVVIEVSARTGIGLDSWIEALERRRQTLFSGTPGGRS
ncbi:MAG: hydrogenase nickel incorporation protein HypB [Isosphaeraceae bacterium]